MRKNPLFPLGARWQGAGWPLLLAGLVGIFYFRVLFQNAIFVFVDSSRFFYPFWKWGGAVLHQGLIPLWNPDAQFGTPYLADPQMAAAYPPLFLAYGLFSPTNAFAGLLVLHHLWAVLGFWFWARHERFTPPAAFLGSLAFGFSLHVVCSSWTPVALFAISWIPWIFWAAQGLWEDYRGSLLGLSLAWAMQISAGYPVLSYLTGLALAAHLLWKSLWPWPRVGWFGKLKWIPGFALAAGLALLYNMVWAIPFAELFRLTNYQNGASAHHALGWADLATWLSPFYRESPLLPGAPEQPYWISTYFMGWPVAALLVWGFWKGVFLRTSVFLSFLFLVLSLGETLFLGGWLERILPGYSLVIRSGFWLPVVVLFAARLVMESSENFFRKNFLKPRALGAWYGGWAFVYGAALLLKVPPAAWSFWVSLALGFLAGAQKWFTPRWRWAFLISSLAVSLGTAAWGVNILLDRSYYDQPPAALSSMGRSGRIFYSPWVLERMKILEGGSMAQAYEGAKQALAPDWPLAFRKEEAPVYNSLFLQSPDNWMWTSLRFSNKHSRRIMDYLNIRYLVGNNNFKDFKPLNPPGAFLPISENPSPLPKWFSVRRALAASSPEDDFKKAADSRMDYGKSCFVEETSRAGNYQGRQVSEVSRTPQRVELSAQGKGTALLVSSETAYPGWRALVGGQTRPLERVNHVFRGLFLNDGESRAVILYEPVSFRLGLFLGLLVCAFWAAGFLGLRLS